LFEFLNFQYFLKIQDFKQYVALGHFDHGLVPEGRVASATQMQKERLLWFSSSTLFMPDAIDNRSK
jgi:hypothetical protein